MAFSAKFYTYLSDIVSLRYSSVFPSFQMYHEFDNEIGNPGDEYNDMEELASGSDPNDPSDIPLIIISNPVCTNAYYGQQYYNPLKVNDNRKRVFWI